MIHHFRVPGEATTREYAVYLMVATHRDTKRQRVYVGKTGDNFDGCNPIISRAGNHLSFNKLHSQTRNHIGNPEDHDFDFFYTTFGVYTPKSESREGLSVINVMKGNSTSSRRRSLAKWSSTPQRKTVTCHQPSGSRVESA